MELQIKFIQSGKQHDYSKPRYSVNIIIDDLEIIIRKSQFDNLTKINKLLEEYKRKQCELYNP